MSSDAELFRKMDEVLKLAPEARHSFFQMRYFIVGKEVTIQAQMWQCLRELEARKETIDATTLEISEIKDRLELLEIKKIKEEKKRVLSDDPKLGTLLDREWLIRCRQYARQQTRMQRSLQKIEDKKKFAIQEARFFLKSFEALQQIEPLKDYDDPDAQEAYWNEKIAQQINLKMLLQQPLDTELVLTALSLHEEAPIRHQMLNTLDHIKTQMAKLKDGYVRRLKGEEHIKELDDRTTQDNECR